MSYFRNINIDDPKGMFNDVNIAERYPIIELKSNYGISALRDITAVTGSGATVSSALRWKEEW